MPILKEPTLTDLLAARADLTMHCVYVGGVAYHTTEFINILARNSAETLRNYKQITSYFGPIWNFVDAVGVLVDAKKDAQNKDPVSAAINTFSGLQLMSATIIGQIALRTNMPMAMGAQCASTLSAGAFALCMFCSAAVAAYKEACLKQDIQNLHNSRNEQDIIDRLILRHPDHKSTLSDLKTRYFDVNTNAHDKNMIRGRYTQILQAEQAYQSTAIAVWTACGIAMTIATLTLPVSGPVMMSIALVMIVISAYARIKLRDAEDHMAQKINKTLQDLEPKENTYFAEQYLMNQALFHNKLSNP